MQKSSYTAPSYTALYQNLRAAFVTTGEDHIVKEAQIDWSYRSTQTPTLRYHLFQWQKGSGTLPQAINRQAIDYKMERDSEEKTLTDDLFDKEHQCIQAQHLPA